MSAPTRKLRPEALPLPWERLSETQQRAFEVIVGWLAEAIANLRHDEQGAHDRRYSTNRDRALPLRIGERRSAVGLISGQRGTGKTSLMLSLMDATCGRRDRCSARPDTAPYVAIETSLDSVRDHIVWLEPLDVDTLPPSTNLLAAILARVSRAIEDRGINDGDRRPTGLFDGETDLERVLTRFDRLRSDIALGWRRDVPSGLDPDAFAVEVNRTELARLRLGERFATILDSLAQLFVQSRNQPAPLFVLPIDDIDLNPGLCFELLQLIRQIAAPRLFTLVLGDADNTELLSRLALAGEYHRLAERSRLFTPVSPEEVSDAVRSTASRLVRKLLPPGQRVVLETMSVDRALAYHPPGETRTVRDLLEAIPVLAELPPDTGRTSVVRYPLPGQRRLADLLLAREAPSQPPARGGSSQRRTGAEERRTSIVDPPYWGIRLLAAPPRQVADLWYLLSALVPDEPSPSEAAAVQDRRAIDLFVDLLKTLVQEEEGLSYAQQSAILSGFRHDAADRPFFHTDVVMLEREMLPGSTTETRFGTVRVREGKRWQLGPWLTVVDGAPREVDLPKHRPLLEDRTAAGVMVVHDLLTLTTEANVVGRPLASAVNQGPGWVATEWQVGANLVSVTWPEPDWLTFREFDLFERMWRGAARAVWQWHETAKREEKADLFARAFVSCIVEAATGRWDYASNEPFSWKVLGSKVDALLADSRAHGVRASSPSTLPVTLACILAPECSLFLRSIVRSDLLAITNPLQTFWAQPWCKRAIRLARAERAKVFYRAGGGSLAERLLAPHRYQEQLLWHIRRATPWAGIRTPTSRTTSSLRSTIERLLEALDGPPRRAQQQRRGMLARNPDLLETVSFLRDALDGLPDELQLSLDHPINRACKGDLCPRADELLRAAGSSPEGGGKIPSFSPAD